MEMEILFDPDTSGGKRLQCTARRVALPNFLFKIHIPQRELPKFKLSAKSVSFILICHNCLPTFAPVFKIH